MISRRIMIGWLTLTVQLAAGPLFAQTVPAGATARCRDGTYSFSGSRRGTCSRHRGVAQWLSARSTESPAPQSSAEQGTLTAGQAKDHVGESATVCGVVASARYAASSRGQPTFLNLDQAYPNATFTVVIWGNVRTAFPEPPEVAYRQKRICVTGLIGTYRGTPQIVPSTPQVIVVMEK